MLTDQDVKEELSYSYLHAVASKAHFECEHKRKDRDSIDAKVNGYDYTDQSKRTRAPRLEVQLKATVRISRNGEHEGGGNFPFSISRKNYDDLRLTERRVPALLVVFLMPEEPARWLDAGEEELITRNCAYWTDLRGAEATDNDTSKTVHVPLDNLLTPSSLREMMDRIADFRGITEGSPEERGVVQHD